MLYKDFVENTMQKCKQKEEEAKSVENIDKQESMDKQGNKDQEGESSRLGNKQDLNEKLPRRKCLKKHKNIEALPESVKRTISYQEAHDCAVRQMKKMAETGKYTQQQATYLMNATFLIRRFYVHKDTPSLAFMLETYPLLFNLMEMKNEIGRILHPRKCEIFLLNVKTYAPLILNTLPKEDPLNDLIQNIIASCAPENKEYATIAGGILALPKILNEPRRFLHLKNEPFQKSEFPYIEAGNYEPKDILEKKARFEITIEDYSLCETCDLPEALLCLVSAYISLNYSYKNANLNTYLMFSHLFLEHVETESGCSLSKNCKKYLDMWQKQANGEL